VGDVDAVVVDGVFSDLGVMVVVSVLNIVVGVEDVVLLC
jgi:hypothetical protein